MMNSMMIRIRNRNIWEINFLIILFLVFIFFSTPVFAQKSASLFLSPSSGSYQVGKTFSINLAVRSEQQAVNAAEATLKFDPTIIRVKSISKSGSIFTLWPVEPNFSNSGGTITFTGGSPNAYKGSSGRIITVTFEGLKEGTASVNFTDGRALAADGLGTDITDQLIGGSYSITPALALPPSPPVTPPSGPLPSAPKISSPTHPDSEKWYNNKNPKFIWELPTGIDAVKTLLTESPTAKPNILSEPPISSKEFTNLKDGVWYFSAQFRNEQGWGSIGRYKIQIDTTPPKEFLVLVDNEGDPKNPTPLFKFETKDETSGIDYYEVILNGNTFAKVKPEEIKDGGWRPTTPLKPGNYTLEVKAFDKAGNFTLGSNYFERILASISFSIESLPLEIFPFLKKIKEGKPLRVEGKTVPEAKVIIYIQKENEVNLKETKSDREGYFKFEEMLSRGKYIIWFQAQDKESVGFSDRYEVEVVKERLILYLSILLIILIIIGLLVIIYLLRKVKKEREKAKIEKAKKLKEEKLKAYKILKEKIEEQIKFLESKVDLSRSETRVLENLKKALKEAEEIRSQEIENEEKI